MKNEILLYESQFDYITLQNIITHSQRYDLENDKRSFLKNVIPYEQKLILLNSTKPYEVLSYLDELDLRSTRLILESLTKEEIKHIIGLFSSEDKEQFYEHFSDLELVNEFIIEDKNAKEYIKDLSFDRKIEILNSSDTHTVESSSVVYNSMSEKEKDEVEDYITTANAASALSDVSVETIENTSISEDKIDEVASVTEDQSNPEVEELINDLKEEETKEQQLEQTKEEETKEQLNENKPIEKNEDEKVMEFKKVVAEVEEEFIQEINMTLDDSLEIEESTKSL